MAGSRAEVEATVTSCFEMLELELRGKDYNKSAHRRREPRLFTLRGALPDALDLDPTEYRAQPKG